MTLYEMEGFLRGKCLPGDMKVNESNAQYLVRKFSELQSQNAAQAEQLSNAESKCRELTEENCRMHDVLHQLIVARPGGVYFNKWEKLISGVLNETPATDAFLAEVRASTRNEGINYAASRLAAAFNHGFVDKPLTEVCDVVRMILDTKEELASSTQPAPDGLSGEYAEKFLEDIASQLKKEPAQ
ncbi:hypothetical protein FYP34_04325 [Salmonella enterica]|nr:hypothetical protein [Salmonella enterica]EAQ5917911.1 hypothetical protein [Salmonella enterica subsp. enterica serovar Inverness]EAW7790241.1 hypothetical protein [Salmonella enterica]EAW7850180.1 hypothetical protein [Salmonella enterica]EAW7859273.1 hypothetical protein [Salmonella enterica]